MSLRVSAGVSLAMQRGSVTVRECWIRRRQARRKRFAPPSRRSINKLSLIFFAVQGAPAKKKFYHGSRRHRLVSRLPLPYKEREYPRPGVPKPQRAQGDSPCTEQMSRQSYDYILAEVLDP